MASFLDLSGGAGAWDPTLGLVMAGALGVTTPLLAAWTGGLGSGAHPAVPPVTGSYTLPKIIGAKPDAALVSGSFLFGAGWGLAGLCPGPALVALGAALFHAPVSAGAAGGLMAASLGSVLLFNGAMATGWAAHHRGWLASAPATKH